MNLNSNRQEFAYKIIKTLQKQGKDKVRINNVLEEEWLNYYKELWYKLKENKTNRG